MKKRSTKRALATSVLSTCACVTMLAGATFAWFTDTASTDVNRIQAGNLDIALVDAGGNSVEGKTLKWKTADKRAQDKILWEPGATYELEPVKVVNEGNLAVKYKVVITGIDGDAELNEAIDWKIDGLDIDKEYKLAAGTSSEKITISGTMKRTAGNEYKGKSIEDISITVVATQDTVESDSFNNQYDKDAIVYDHYVGTLDELKEAFAEGGSILLTKDVQFEKMTAIEPGTEVYLNMNGKTITVDSDTTSNTLIYVKDGGKLTIDGNGTFDLKGVSTMALFAPYGELVIENGTFIRDEVTTLDEETTGLFMGSKSTGLNVTINGGYFDSGYYDAKAEDAFNGKFVETDAANKGKSADKNAIRIALKNNVSSVLNYSGYGSFKIYGGTFVGANPAWGDEGCALPTTPNYLRPWSYYQGTFLDGQVVYDDRVEVPAGYTITEGKTADGRPTFTVNYSE